MKTTWYSLIAAALTGLTLVGCNPSSADKAKDRIEDNKDAKVNAIDEKAEAEKERVKREAEMKKDQIDANAKATEAARDQAAQNLENQADAKRREADLIEKKANEVKKD